MNKACWSKDQQGQKNALSADELRRIRETLEQNKQLQERVQNLEVIVTSLDRKIPLP